MCGRFVSNTPPDELARFLRAQAPDPGTALDPSHNIAPTQLVHAARETRGVRRLDSLRWGLVPSWAKAPRTGSRMINARAETAAAKNAFRSSLTKRRCIIPADGFYEWQRLEGSKHKQPMFISHPDAEPFAFAGLWAVWHDRDDLDPDGEPIELHSCTILTCAANTAIAEIHDRMPVILPDDTWEFWLDPTNTDAEAMTELLVPAPAETIRMHPVSTEVNNTRNDGPHLIERLQTH
ncbi:MAG: SOS response-associated peptidase [Acidimicrobiaceae bacterium]|nr:SOS response-associated peptidase [Acidimicrobiaceae bacterium]